VWITRGYQALLLDAALAFFILNGTIFGFDLFELFGGKFTAW
jgi:hypothetical protein